MAFQKYFGKKTKFLIITIATFAILLRVLSIPFVSISSQTYFPIPSFVAEYFVDEISKYFWEIGEILVYVFLIECLIWVGIVIFHFINYIKSKKITQ